MNEPSPLFSPNLINTEPAWKNLGLIKEIHHQKRQHSLAGQLWKTDTSTYLILLEYRVFDSGKGFKNCEYFDQLHNTDERTVVYSFLRTYDLYHQKHFSGKSCLNMGLYTFNKTTALVKLQKNVYDNRETLLGWLRELKFHPLQATLVDSEGEALSYFYQRRFLEDKHFVFSDTALVALGRILFLLFFTQSDDLLSRMDEIYSQTTYAPDRVFQMMGAIWADVFLEEEQRNLFTESDIDLLRKIENKFCVKVNGEEVDTDNILWVDAGLSCNQLKRLIMKFLPDWIVINRAEKCIEVADALEALKTHPHDSSVEDVFRQIPCTFEPNTENPDVPYLVKHSHYPLKVSQPSYAAYSVDEQIKGENVFYLYHYALLIDRSPIYIKDVNGIGVTRLIQEQMENKFVVDAQSMLDMKNNLLNWLDYCAFRTGENIVIDNFDVFWNQLSIFHLRFERRLLNKIKTMPKNIVLVGQSDLKNFDVPYVVNSVFAWNEEELAMYLRRFYYRLGLILPPDEEAQFLQQANGHIGVLIDICTEDANRRYQNSVDPIFIMRHKLQFS